MRNQLITDLWWFIENVTDETPDKNERFFALRERVRALQADVKPTILMEKDGRDVYIYGIAMAPENFDFSTAYNAAISGEEWTYDDIFSELAKQGVSVIRDFQRFYEHEAI